MSAVVAYMSAEYTLFILRVPRVSHAHSHNGARCVLTKFRVRADGAKGNQSHFCNV